MQFLLTFSIFVSFLLLSSNKVLAHRRHGPFVHAEHVLRPRAPTHYTLQKGCEPYKVFIDEAFSELKLVATQSIAQVNQPAPKVVSLREGLWGSSTKTPNQVLICESFVFIAQSEPLSDVEEAGAQKIINPTPLNIWCGEQTVIESVSAEKRTANAADFKEMQESIEDGCRARTGQPRP